MSTAEKKQMTREEWDQTLAKIHADLDSVPEELPSEASLSTRQIFAGVVPFFMMILVMVVLAVVQFKSLNAGPIVYFIGGALAAVVTGLAVSVLSPRRDR